MSGLQERDGGGGGREGGREKERREGEREGKRGGGFLGNEPPLMVHT